MRRRRVQKPPPHDVHVANHRKATNKHVRYRSRTCVVAISVLLFIIILFTVLMVTEVIPIQLPDSLRSILRSRKSLNKSTHRQPRRNTPSQSPSKSTHASNPNTAPVFNVQVLGKYPHDKTAFTQGLSFSSPEDNNRKTDKGVLYESTGLYGESTIRRTTIEDGQVLDSKSLANQDFGEGITFYNSSCLVQVLWKVGKGYIYDKSTFERVSTFDTGHSDAWGVAQVEDGSAAFYLSDGTPVIRVFEVMSAAAGEDHDENKTVKVIEKRRIRVTDGGNDVGLLNELEMVNGELWANVLLAQVIVRIDVNTGVVIGWLDLQDVVRDVQKDSPPGHTIDVLNGIAYDEGRDIVYVTGKLWPKMYAVRVVDAAPVATSVRRVVQNAFFLNDRLVQRVLDSM